MRIFRLLPAVLLFGIGVWCTSTAHAQGGSCRDPWINQAYNQNFHRAPSGSGTSGECNTNLYGGGSWTSYNDLSLRVVHSKDCGDAWIGQVYYNLYNRRPSAQECVAGNYGSWSNYMDLASKVQAYQSRMASAGRPQLAPPPAGGYGAPSQNGSGLVAAGGGNAVNRSAPIVAAGGGNIVAAGGGNIVAAGGGNIVAAGGGNVVNKYSVQSVGSTPHAQPGKYLVAPNGALVDQNGSVLRNPGTFRAIVRAGNYVLSSSGTYVPPAGSTVLPY